jgi:sugar phosphate isomerase/epimerase
MYYTGFADEASQDLNLQIAATKELGWKFIESRNINGTNIHNLTDEQFEQAYATLSSSGVQINCFGSAIANWAKDITKAEESSLEETKRAIVRMNRLGTKLIRIMSYAVLPELPPEKQMLDKRVEKLKKIVGLFLENGITPVHENCMNYGGMGASYTLELMDRLPGMKLVFDTGNPIFTDDRDQPKPYPKQSAWNFYKQVRDHISYVHIKDGRYDFENKVCLYSFPEEGDGDVRKIVKDLLMNGYQGGFSMEPHMATVFHDKTSERPKVDGYTNYIEYGKRFVKMVDGINKELSKGKVNA